MTAILQVALLPVIVLTLAAVALPALFAPGYLVEALGLGKPLMTRLFGVVLTALCVGLTSAWLQLRRGRMPKTLLLVAFLAYSGIAVIIAYSGITGRFILLADWLIWSLWCVAAAASLFALVFLLGLLAQPRDAAATSAQ